MNRRLIQLLAISAASAPLTALAQAPLGNPPVPPGNPITEPKRALGKILFWDEQLSSSNTVSCGTCHTPEAGGGDARRSRNAGSDGLFMTDDDVFGSPGVIGASGSNDFSPVPGGVLFASQVTGRSSNTAFMAAFSTLNFWDGRAGPSLVDPVTGVTVLAGGAALEAQSLGPPVSNVEMAHFGRTWPQILTKLAGAQPLALVDNVPPDVEGALADNPSYPVLFQRAFGTPDITASRVAMAIATYERTLVPNRTPWDRYVAGETAALTPHQVAGLAAFNSAASKCTDCHGSNRFTDNAFHNIGVRPSVEDPGRESVTGNPNDLGKFKTPSLRNVGLRNSFFHNGQATTLRQTVDFYTQVPGALPQFTDNLDPSAVGIVLTEAETVAMVDFMQNGLTDPRVAASQFPFDKPRLWSLRAPLAPQSLGGGTIVPGYPAAALAIASDPAMIGQETRIGVGLAPVGYSAVLRISAAAPVGGQLSGGETLPAATISNEGAATVRVLVDGSKYPPGVPQFVQWELSQIAGGPVVGRSNVARIVPFCPRGGCPNLCAADLGSAGGFSTPDGALDNNDFIVFIDLFFAQAPAADMGMAGGEPGADGLFDNNDFIAFIDRFFEGC